jgi:hypothetical protein
MIKIVDIESFISKNNVPGPITSPQTFLGKTKTFHPQGIMSEEIFGLEGSPERSSTFSWIELGCKVIEPVLYDVLTKRIEKKISGILSGDIICSINNEGRLIEDPDGDIDGFTSFVKNIHRLRFVPGDSVRNKLIDMLYKNISKETFFTSRLLVIPPRHREIMIPEETGESIEIGDMNEIYRKIIIQSNQVKNVSGPLYDILSFKMQQLVKDMYEFVRIKVGKKEGMIRNLMLGRRVDFSARGVITPNPKLRIGVIGVPLRMVCGIFEPYLIYGLVNSPQAKDIPTEFHEAVKDALGRELEPELL